MTRINVYTRDPYEPKRLAGNGGGFCDGARQPNGRYCHCVHIGILGGFGGGCGFVCDNPANPALPIPNDGNSPC